MPTFDQSKLGYATMWRGMAVKPEKVAAADAIVARILAHKDTYQKVEAAIGVPWFFVACLHYRESDLDFKTHLHNGDPLTARTYHVPAGRPPTGEPPFAWYTSAIDALEMRGLQDVKDWSAARIAYEAEGYNGWGYTARDINSPYVWSWSNMQQPGKFISDGHFDASVVDIQCGVMVLVSRLRLADQSVAAFLNQTPAPAPAPQPQPAPTPAPVQKETSTVTTPAPAVTISIPHISTIDFAGIEKGLETALQFLPMVATFVPALAPVVTLLTQALPVIRAVASVGTGFQADIAAGKTTLVAIADALPALAAALKAA